MSRTKNSIYNIFYNLGLEILSLVLSFLTRTIFINTLGLNYLGINGLFTHIISMLSLAELGIGSAIIFHLYDPIAKDNHNKIRQLLKLYNKAYKYVAVTIAILSLIIFPLLPHIINEDITYVNLPLIFFIYVLQSITSFLFGAYKSAIIRADQKEYIISKVNCLLTVVIYIIQIVTLILFKNFILYLLIVVINNIVRNIILAIKATKMYPFIKNGDNSELSKTEKSNIYKDCSAIFIYSVNSVILNATDNIILSKYIGLIVVGLYSNYLLLFNASKRILVVFYSAITASLGNLHVTKNIKHEKEIFELINFITITIFGVSAICICILANEFIVIWLGEEFIISDFFAFLLAAELYMYGIMKFLAVFRNSMGLFQQAKYRPIFGIIINLFVSIIAVQYIGIYGVLIGTLTANLCTYTWYDPLIIYKNVFKSSVKKYYLDNLKYLLVVFISGVITYYIINLINYSNIIYFILKGLLSVVISSTIIILIFIRTKEVKNIISRIKIMLTMLSNSFTNEIKTKEKHES